MPLNARAPVYGFAHYVKANDVLVWLVERSMKTFLVTSTDRYGLVKTDIRMSTNIQINIKRKFPRLQRDVCMRIQWILI